MIVCGYQVEFKMLFSNKKNILYIYCQNEYINIPKKRIKDVKL